jgi:predicted ferric reductase
MHLTKRFGLVTASQLPLHYLLAMKSPYSPVQLLLRTSHENLNLVHQVLGRVIMLFLFLHASFYINFFIRTGFWVNRFKNLDVILGLTSISVVALIGSSAMGFVRRWNYRLFYSIHAVAPIVLLSLLYFHVHHIRVYVSEALFVALLNVALRFWSSKTVPAELTRVPGSSLLRISLQKPIETSTWTAGNHVYTRKSNSVASCLRANPFTISTLPSDEEGRIVLIARKLRGNTHKLAQMAPDDSSNLEKTTPTSFTLEGPYGHSAYLPDLDQFERILFVAGGVGVTFILPLWRQVLEVRASKSLKYQEVKFIWSVKQAEDATWAFDSIKENLQLPSGSDERELYITAGEMRDIDGNESVELTSTASATNISKKTKDAGFSLHHGRPDLRQAVDEVATGNSGRVAIFVCGPSGMGRSMRRHVGRWVLKGRDIYWHAEEFGM